MEAPRFHSTPGKTGRPTTINPRLNIIVLQPTITFPTGSTVRSRTIARSGFFIAPTAVQLVKGTGNHQLAAKAAGSRSILQITTLYLVEAMTVSWKGKIMRQAKVAVSMPGRTTQWDMELRGPNIASNGTSLFSSHLM